MKHSLLYFLVILLNFSCLGTISPPFGFKEGYYTSKKFYSNDRPNYSSLEVKEGKIVLETICATLEIDTIPGVSKKNTFSTIGKFIQRVPSNSPTYIPTSTKPNIKVSGYFKSENVVIIKLDVNSYFSPVEFEFIYGIKTDVLKCDNILD